MAFCACSSLSSICIPMSVAILGHRCFASCASLSRVTFESDSNLARIEPSAFEFCPSLSLSESFFNSIIQSCVWTRQAGMASLLEMGEFPTILRLCDIADSNEQWPFFGWMRLWTRK
jgi:hypothetical protein